MRLAWVLLLLAAAACGPALAHSLKNGEEEAAVQQDPAAPDEPAAAEPGVPPATAEVPPLSAAADAAASRSPFASPYPPAEWASQDLARRGFVRNPNTKLVAIDPGHGGSEVGSGYNGLAEKTVNLSIAWKLRTLLEADGIQVVMTREDNGRAYTVPDDPGASRAQYRADLQARVDIANASGADVFVAVHNNGSGNRAEAGTEVWYAPDRPFGDENWRLANAVLEGLLGELRAAGYDSPSRGLKDGSHFRVFGDRVLPLFVLGNPRPAPNATRATQMPGVLGESLFLSNAHEGWLLTHDHNHDAIARGYRAGILQYLGR